MIQQKIATEWRRRLFLFATAKPHQPILPQGVVAASQSVSGSVNQSVCQSVGLLVCRSVGLSVSRFVGLSVCRPVGLSVIRSVC